MELRPNPGIAEEFAAAIDWWKDAGVDRIYDDEPIDWLPVAEPDAASDDGRGRQPVEPKKPAQPEAPKLDLSALPADLAEFQAWWLADPLLDDGRVAGRLPPRGAAHPDVMVLVPEPEREDGESLLSGPQGRLLAAMLSAMQLMPEQTYLASALPSHSPGFDWDSDHAKSLGVILRHHIGLASPKRIIVLGFNILPLIGHELPQRPAILQSFNHEGRTIPTLVARSLPALMEMPGWKVALWRAWLEWDRS